MEPTINRRTLLSTGIAGTAALMAGAAPGVVKAAGAERHNLASPITLTWGWWSNSPTKDAQFKAWASEYSKVNTNVSMKGEILAWGNYWDKLHTTLAGGNAYDVIGCASGQVTTYMADNLFVDLSTFPDYKMVAAQLGTTPVALYSWNNKQYGLPTGIALWSVGYNKDMFKAAGVSFPSPTKPMSFAQFIKISQQLTIKKAGKVSQWGLMPEQILDWNDLVDMEGGQVYDRQINPTKMTINTPAGIRGLADYQSMFTLGVTPPIDHHADFAGGSFPSMQTGKVAIASIGPWNFSTIATTTFKVGLCPTPKIIKAVSESGANGWAIYKGSKNINAAWEFIKWAVSEKAQLEYVTFSDIPANKAAFARIGSAVKPTDYVPTLLAQVPAYKPGVLTVSTTLAQALTTISMDLARGKLTPEKAAAAMEDQGNAAIAQNS